MKLSRKLASSITLFIFLTSINAYAAGSAAINSLQNQQRVTTPEYLEGTCSDIQKGIYLWIVVRSKLTQNYHPQSDRDNYGPLSNGCSGTWESIAYIGKNAATNKNEKFEILLVGTNQQGSIEMQNYLNQASQTYRWHGMPSLPDKTTIYQKIEVTRR